MAKKNKRGNNPFVGTKRKAKKTKEKPHEHEKNYLCNTIITKT